MRNTLYWVAKHEPNTVMKKHILPLCLVSALCLATAACAESQGSLPHADPPAAVRADEEGWARLDVYHAPPGGRHVVKAYPGGFLKVDASSGYGMYHLSEFLLARVPGGHRYQILFAARSTNHEGDSITVKGSTVEYHFNHALWRNPPDEGTVVSYPISVEGADAWKADAAKYQTPRTRMLQGGRSEGGVTPDLESADGSLLLFTYIGCNLFVRCADGVNYHPVASLSADKPVQTLWREGDALVVQAADGSVCRLPLACGRYYVPLGRVPEAGKEWSPEFDQAVAIMEHPDAEAGRPPRYFIGVERYYGTELGELPAPPEIAGASSWCVLITGVAKDGGFSLVRKKKSHPLQVTELTPLCRKALDKKGAAAGALTPLWAELPGRPPHWQGPREPGRVYFSMRAADGSEYVFSLSPKMDVRVEK